MYPIEDLWGVGSRLAARLEKMGIKTAIDIRDSDPKLMRKSFSVVMERMVLELRGISCLPLEKVQPRKQIMCSRSFGKLVTELDELEEAISSYAATACLKLRTQQGISQGIYVFLHTNIFRESDRQYGNSICYYFPEATDHTGYISHTAKKCLRKIYRNGYKYHKVGIMLLDLLPNTIQQMSLFSTEDKKKKDVINTIDKINAMMGRKTIFYLSEGVKRNWSLKREMKSPCYTTRCKRSILYHPIEH